MDRFDVLVLGGATVGAAASLALEQLGQRVGLIDARGARSLDADAPLDSRVVAISPGTRRLLEALGAWRHLRAERIAAYHDMQVMSGGGQVEFSAAEHDLPALGWIVELAELDRALWFELAGRRRIELFCPETSSDMRCESDGVEVTLANGHSLRASMLLGADGRNSRVRTALGVEQRVYDYNQQAIVAHLDTEKLNPGIAWQRFTEPGPLALLPLPDARSSLVWSVHDDMAERLLSLDDDAFLALLSEHAKGSPMGAFESTGRRHAHPLMRCQSMELARGRGALLGDAARSVHPLAGQGLNLGLGDVACLIEMLAGLGRHEDPSRRLGRYARRRGSDSRLVAGGIHLINEVRALGEFGRQGMGAAFGLLSLSQAARDLFVQRACGLREVRPVIERLECC